MGADLSENMHYAKQLYLYGEGDGKPVKNLAKLSELSGVQVSSIRRYVKEWRKISTQLAISAENSNYSLSLSEEVLTQHRKEIEFLGKQVQKLRIQLKELDPGAQNYHVVLGSYERALTKWEKSSGILAHYNTAESAMKERARQHERAKGKLPKPKAKPSRKVDKSKFALE